MSDQEYMKGYLAYSKHQIVYMLLDFSSRPYDINAVSMLLRWISRST